MVVPQFLRFYNGYTLASVLSEFAVAFFSLVNSMYRIRAQETLDGINQVAVGFSGHPETVSRLQKAADGIHGIVQEARVIKGVKK